MAVLKTLDHSLSGGLWLDGHKAISLGQSIQHWPTPSQVMLPLLDKNGARRALVNVGETVKAGQCVAICDGIEGSALHAPYAGTVRQIAALPNPQMLIDVHPSPSAERCTLPETSTLVERIDAAGIVGMGGAGFATARKLGQAVETLIINAAECEPYITCDEALLRENAAEVIAGAKLAQTTVGAKRLIIGIESNKTKAIEALNQYDGFELVAVPPKYPSGGERQLIELLLDVRLSAGQRPVEQGLAVINVHTAYAIANANEGRPLTERVVTITGSAVAEPANYWLPIGLPVKVVLDTLGIAANARVRLGGAMMGRPIDPDLAVISKTSNCLLIETPVDSTPVSPCIRCGACEPVCPEGLLPAQLHFATQPFARDMLERYHLSACIECACCDHVCPSAIPLATQFGLAKQQLNTLKQSERSAQRAGERHNAREARLERIAAEKKARMEAKKAALKKRTAK